MDKTAETLIDVSGFISEYSAHMMGCGVHPSRGVRGGQWVGDLLVNMLILFIYKKKKKKEKRNKINSLLKQ